MTTTTETKTTSGLERAKATFVSKMCKAEKCGECDPDHGRWPCTHDCHKEGEGTDGAPVEAMAGDATETPAEVQDQLTPADDAPEPAPRQEGQGDEGSPAVAAPDGPVPTSPALADLDEAGARDLTDRIRDAAESTFRLLREAHDRRAWAALGYASYVDYAHAEFGMAKTHAYQLLNQARVVEAIEEAAGDSADAENVHISEAAARDIKPVLPDVVEDVREQVAAGTEPAEAVKKAVDKARADKPKPEGRYAAEERKAKEKRAKAVAKLKAAGVHIVESSKGEQMLAVEGAFAKVGVAIDPKDHAGEPCHAATVGWKGEITYLCLDRESHGPGGTSALRAPNIKTTGAMRDANDEQRQAFVHDLVFRPFSPSSDTFVLKATLLNGYDVMVDLAINWLDIDPGDFEAESANEALFAWAELAPDNGRRALYAIALAICEPLLAGEQDGRFWGSDAELVKAYLEHLEEQGYEITAIDREALDDEAE